MEPVPQLGAEGSAGQPTRSASPKDLGCAPGRPVGSRSLSWCPCAAARASRSGALDGAPKVKSSCDQSRMSKRHLYFVAKHTCIVLCSQAVPPPSCTLLLRLFHTQSHPPAPTAQARPIGCQPWRRALCWTWRRPLRCAATRHPPTVAPSPAILALGLSADRRACRPL